MGVAPRVQDLTAPPPAIGLPDMVSSRNARVKTSSNHAYPSLTQLYIFQYQTSITQSPHANCDPSYKRSTLNAIPANSQLLQKSRLPLGLVITPYRSVKEGDVSSSVFDTMDSHLFDFPTPKVRSLTLHISTFFIYYCQEEVPVVTDSIIARCRRCRTYINPFVKFVEGGQRWKCNMCYTLNEG